MEYIPNEDEDEIIELTNEDLQNEMDTEEVDEEMAEESIQTEDFRNFFFITVADMSSLCIQTKDELPLYSVAINQQFLIMGGGNDSCSLFDLQSQRPIAYFNDFGDSIVDIKYYKDQKYFYAAMASMNGRLLIIPLNPFIQNMPHSIPEDGIQIENKLEISDPEEITTIQWSPNAPLLAIGTATGLIWVYAIPSLKYFVLQTNSRPVQTLKWSLDGKSLYCGHSVGENDQEIALVGWDLVNKMPRWKMSDSYLKTGNVQLLALPVHNEPQQSQQSIAQSTVSQPEQQKVTKKIEISTRPLVQVVELSEDPMETETNHEPEPEPEPEEEEESSGILCLDSHPSKPDLLAIGHSSGLLCLLTNGKIIGKYQIHQQSVEQLKWFPKGIGMDDFLVTCSTDGKALVFDCSGGKIRMVLTHPSGVHKLCIDHKTGYIITACLNHYIYVWNPKSGNLIHEWKGHLDIIHSLDCENGLVVSGDELGACRVWEI